MNECSCLNKECNESIHMVKAIDYMTNRLLLQDAFGPWFSDTFRVFDTCPAEKYHGSQKENCICGDKLIDRIVKK